MAVSKSRRATAGAGSNQFLHSLTVIKDLHRLQRIICGLAMEVLMQATHIVEHARQLLAAHGDKAEVEAAQKASERQAEGKTDEAEDWRKIRAAIRELRPPHVS